MTTSRRNVLKSSIALAAGAALSSLPQMRSAMAATASRPTAAETLAAIRGGQTTAVAVVQAALDRAESTRHLNAQISIAKDEALAAARKVDAARAAG
jgi:hypothetical protein